MIVVKCNACRIDTSEEVFKCIECNHDTCMDCSHVNGLCIKCWRKGDMKDTGFHAW